MAKQRKYNRFNSISPASNFTISVLLIILAAITVFPLLLVVSISITPAESVTANGYKLIPDSVSLTAYTTLFKTGQQLLDSYIITIFYTITGTIMSLTVMSMFAFVLAQQKFRFRTIYTFILFFTMLFSGGLVPSYIINVRYLHLKDTVWIFLLPSLVSAYNVIILRTFIQTTIPDSLFEAAKIDGASNFTVFFRIVLPLFKPGLATIGLFNVVTRWNDWFTGMLYIDNPKLIPLQTLLQRILRNIQFIKNNSQLEGTREAQEILASMPTESTRMAITVLIVIPILFAYPFFQRYFIEGLTIGSIKG
jgi:putative aldouronate transport system permease protein